MKRFYWVVAVVLTVFLTVSVAALAQEQSTCTITVNPSESIQKAIDNAPAGAVICLGKGTWNENIKITKSLTIRGQGSSDTIIIGTTTGYPVVLVSTPAVNKQAVLVTLEGIGIRHRWQTAQFSCANPSKNICGFGILARGAGRVTISDITVSDSKAGIVLSQHVIAKIINSAISKVDDGVMLLDSAQATITGSTISSNKNDGIFIANSARATINDNRISGNKCGIFSDSTGKITGKGNRLQDNGIDLAGNLPGTLRVSLVPATAKKITYPDRHYSSLQMAVDALLPGGELILQAGTYKGGITIAKDLQLIGAKGGRATITGNGDMVISVVGDASLTVTGLTITGGTDGIRLGANSRAMITACTVSKNSYGGIWLSGSAQATIMDNQIDNNMYGIYSKSSGEVSGSGNRMHDNGVDLAGNVPGALRIPLAVPTEEKITYPNPNYPCLQAAVDALQPGGTLVLTGNDCTKKTVEMTISYTRGGITIAKKLNIVAAPGADVSIMGHGGPVFSLVQGADLTLTGVALSSGSMGLILGADARATISNCQIGATDYGIVLQKTARTQIVDSEINRNNGRGLMLEDASRAVISDSTISDNLGEGIALFDAAQAVISHSTISKNEVCGIMSHDSATITINGSAISGNQADGVDLLELAHGTITDSTIAKNLGDGIAVSGFAQARISWTTISGNLLAGISLSDASQTTISGNKITGNGGYGVAVYQPPCSDTSSVFIGYITGKGNYIPGAGKPDGNNGGAVCPQELKFLTTTHGGELDQRQ